MLRKNFRITPQRKVILQEIQKTTDHQTIEWIEIIADGKAYRQFLKPGDAPEATFNIEAEQVTAREYCNLHGLWKG